MTHHQEASDLFLVNGLRQTHDYKCNGTTTFCLVDSTDC